MIYHECEYNMLKMVYDMHLPTQNLLTSLHRFVCSSSGQLLPLGEGFSKTSLERLASPYLYPHVSPSLVHFPQSPHGPTIQSTEKRRKSLRVASLENKIWELFYQLTVFGASKSTLFPSFLCFVYISTWAKFFRKLREFINLMKYQKRQSSFSLPFRFWIS